MTRGLGESPRAPRRDAFRRVALVDLSRGHRGGSSGSAVMPNRVPVHPFVVGSDSRAVRRHGRATFTTRPCTRQGPRRDAIPRFGPTRPRSDLSLRAVPAFRARFRERRRRPARDACNQRLPSTPVSRRAPIDRTATRTPHAFRRNGGAPAPSREMGRTSARRASRHPMRFRAGTVSSTAVACAPPSFVRACSSRIEGERPTRLTLRRPTRDAPPPRMSPGGVDAFVDRDRRRPSARERVRARVDRERLPSDDFTDGDFLSEISDGGTVVP